jgi:hypothetical protein
MRSKNPPDSEGDSSAESVGFLGSSLPKRVVIIFLSLMGSADRGREGIVEQGAKSDMLDKRLFPYF